MTLKQNVKIVKVSNNNTVIDNPQVFPRMPRLYLELLENKSKIKQDLINKEYIPEKSVSPKKDSSSLENKLDKLLEQKDSNYNIENEKNKDDISDKEDNDLKDEIDIKNEKNKDYNDDYDDDLNYKNDDDDDEDDSQYKKNKKNKKNKKYKDDTSDDEEPESEYKSKKKYDDDDNSSGGDDLSVRLNELLNDDSDSQTVISHKNSNKDKYSKQRYDNISVSSKNKYDHVKNVAPSLSELESQGAYTKKTFLRDVNRVSYSEQEEEHLKRELMFKFDMLKKKYPNGIIPEYTIHSDYLSMKRSYEDTIKILSLDSTVDQYKTYLIGGFMACEFILGKFFNLEMVGFTQQQIISINSYERLLIELGEKSYVPTGSKWPVELRLLFMILMNAGFFLISKMILKKTGANVLGMINSMNVTEPKPTGPKKKMKGPSIDVTNME